VSDEPERVDEETGHASDKAELDKRDRPQPSLVTDQANFRADGDAKPDREERRAAIDSLESSSDGSIADHQRDEVDEASDDE
jgi:hypothetical protein